MADQGIPFLGIKPDPDLLGACPPKAEHERKLVAERTADEEQGLTLLHRRLELAVGRGGVGRHPCRQVVGLLALRPNRRHPAIPPELRLELPGADPGDVGEGPEAEQLESLELPVLEPQLCRRERGQEAARVVHPEQPAGASPRRRDPRREGTRGEPESRLGAGGLSEAPAHLAQRQGWLEHPLEVDPGGSRASHLDHRREVVEGCRDPLRQPCSGGRVGFQQLCVGAELLRLALAHPRPDTGLDRLRRGADDRLPPGRDHHRPAVEVGPESELEVRD